MSQIIDFNNRKKDINDKNSNELERLSKIFGEIDAEAVARAICGTYNENVDNTLLIRHDRKEFEKWSQALDDQAKIKKQTKNRPGRH